ncbi:MAG: hypothetical protein ACT4OI_06340 [Methanobacteriota archaeon]
MTSDIFVYPKTTGAVHWLHVHTDELRTAFRSAHGGSQKLEGGHPHGLQVLLPPITTESSFDPSKEPEALYAYISTHGDKSHVRRTLKDLKRVLADLGANLAEFDIEVA